MNAVRRSRPLRKIFEQGVAVNNVALSERRSLVLERSFSRHAALCAGKTEDFVVKSVLSDPVVPDVGLIERLWRDSDNFKKHVAVECAETGKKITFEQLRESSARFATSLRTRLGVESKDVVAVMMPNCPEYPVLVFGTLQAGAILTTINPIYKEFEIMHQLKLTEPKVIVTAPECYNTIVKALDKIKATAKIIVVNKPNESIPEGTVSYAEVAESGAIDAKLLDRVEAEKNKGDIALLPFSSGTTGLPKGVAITINNIMGAIDMMHQERVSLPILTSGDHQDVVPCVLPFFHIYGLVVVMMGHLSRGCKLVTLSKFSTTLYLDVLKNQKASLLYVVPPIALLLSKHPDVKEEHLRSVRHILCGAAPISASDMEPLFEKSKGKLTIRQGYGATETTSVGTMSYLGADPDYSAVGMPMGGVELMFADPLTGKPVPIGTEGELLIKGVNIMKGYYKNEKSTKESLTEDGFYRTGDLGYYKPESGLYITDRIKELIKVKGMQVAPAELESLLRSHPAVQDAAVIGIPHEISGEVPKAFIITKRGQNTNEEELQEFVAKQVAVFKKIEMVQFVEEIPKTASGKILRKELKKMYA